MYPPQYSPNPMQQQMGVGVSISSVMRSVYAKMFLALLVTAGVSLWASTSFTVLSFLAKSMWAFMIAEIVLVIAISAGINKLSSVTATALFYLFAVVNGLTLSPIFIVYTGVSIAKTFFITAGTFGVMSIVGYTTKQDLSRFGSILIMALIGLIIASLVNVFTKSTTMGWIISCVGVLLFTGLTAWDTQQIKNMAAMADASIRSKLATIGALNLYLDFVNMFLYLLRFFGNRN